MSGESEGRDEDLNAVTRPHDVPDDRPDPQSSLEKVDVERERKKTAIDDQRQSMGERSLAVKVVLGLSVFVIVALIVFMFLAGLGKAHIPDSAWPYLFGSLSVSVLLGLISYFLPKKPP